MKNINTPKYIIITNNKAMENTPEDVVNEQYEKREVFGLNGSDYICHYFSNDIYRVVPDIDEAIQYLNIKEGYDMVQFDNGNIGFVAYYDGAANGFEVIG